MKNQLSAIIGCVFAVSAMAQEIKSESGKQDPINGSERYCATLKDGKIILMQDDKPVDLEVSLNDGSKVTTAGIVIRKDGTVITLNNGDCIDKEGNINNMTAPQTPVRKEERKPKKVNHSYTSKTDKK